MSGQPGLRDAALAYAAAGWPVFPCKPGGKIPAFPSAHPEGDRQGAACRGDCGRAGHGFHDATTDPEQITRWWDRNPDWNVAIATGTPGPDVVDVDNHGERGSGFAAWNELQRAGLVECPRALVRTPGGGFHAYFAGSDQPSGKIPGRHLDWRARGGYVVAPPSQVGGRPYQVVHHQPGTAGVDFAAIRGLLDPQPHRPAPAIRRGAGRDTSLDRLVEWTARRQAGDRNFPLFYAAKQAALSGLLDAEAVERFVDAAGRAGLRGGEREARRTIASAQRSAGYEAEAG
jgi:hypothetical protein